MLPNIAATIKALIATLVSLLVSLLGLLGGGSPAPTAYDLLSCVPRVHFEEGVSYPAVCPTEVSITAGVINGQDPIYPEFTTSVPMSVKPVATGQSTDLAITITGPCGQVVGTFSTAGTKLKPVEVGHGEPTCSYIMTRIGLLPETILLDFFSEQMTVTRHGDGVHLTNSQGFLVVEDL
jgi:hypothetical protein